MKKEVQVFLMAFFVSGGIFAALMAVTRFKDEGGFSLGEFFITFLLWGLFQGFLFVWIYKKYRNKGLDQ